MGLTFRARALGTGQATSVWPVLLLLLAAVMVPTACVLWFMSKAMANERLAVRQKLSDAYRGQLLLSQGALDAFWNQKTQRLDQLSNSTSGAPAFARAVSTGLADALVCFDGDGTLVYPNRPVVSTPASKSPAWVEARQLESSTNTLTRAAEAYATIADQSSDPDESARAFQAQIRCLVRAGQPQAAISVVAECFGSDRFDHAVDPEGRLIAASAELMALELSGDPRDPRFGMIWGRLKQRLLDYDNASLTAAQRRFLMRRAQPLPVGPELQAWLDAEDLAAQWAEKGAPITRDPVVRSSLLAEGLEFTTQNGRMVALYKRDHIVAQLQETLVTQGLPPDVKVALASPGDDLGAFLVSVPAARMLPGWRLGLSFGDQKLFEAAARQQITAYLWTGLLVVTGMAILLLVAGRAVRRQMQLTRMKNDLVATVSHELKTPIASMRLLVETLLDAPRFDETTVRDYLHLLAKENQRLGRLVDNFLMFSRLDRRKHAFKFHLVSPAEIVDTASEAVRDRLGASDCQLTTEVAPNLPRFAADPDSLATALINLLENACKYTPEDKPKHVRLRAYAENGNVCFAVTDEGIGLSARETKRIFEQFYQVDQRLSRDRGGCGLGLSIVDFIVRAHAGTIQVASQPGKGSTFTITIPIEGPESSWDELRRITETKDHDTSQQDHSHR